jgi:TonB family protein
VKPFPIAIASAFAIHAAAAGSFAAFGVARGTGTKPAIGPSRTVDVEVEATPALPALAVRRPPPPERPRERRSSRGAPSAHCLLPATPLAAVATAATATATTSNAAPQQVPTSAAPAHFAMTVSNIGAPPAGGDTRGTASAAPEVLAEASVTTRAHRIGGVDPAYPAEAAAQGVELAAPLAFEIVVDPDGRVSSAHELGHAGYGFDEAAVAALQSFRFSPATRDGKAVWVRMRWTVEFRLE